MTSKSLLLSLLVLPFLGCTSFSSKVKLQNVMENNSTQHKHSLPLPYKNNAFMKHHTDKQLERYLHEVVQNNNDLNALKLTKKSLALGMKMTRANIYPRGDFSLSNSKRKEGRNSKLSNNLSTDVTMHWDLDLWGKLSDEYEASKRAYFSMEHQYLEQKRVLLLNATIDWINHWYLAQVVQNQKVLLSKYKTLTRHYLETSNAGLKDRYFYLEARRTQELVQSAIFESELSLVNVRHQLNLYRGVAPSTPLPITQNKRTLPLSLRVDRSTSMSKEIAHRHDVQEALFKLKATKFLEKSAYKALLPQISLSLGASKSVQSLSKLFSGQLLWEFVGGMTQPLFHAEQLQTLAEQKSLESAIAWRAYQEVVLQALLEVQSALASENALKKQLKHKERFYANLLLSLQSSKEKTLEGISDFADYLQEEANAIDEKNNLLSLKTEYVKNRLRLISALGYPLLKEKKKER